MSVVGQARRVRAQVAGSPTLRKAAGKLLTRMPVGGARGNASAWTLPAGSLEPLAERYADFELSPISYGTARDLSDSIDHLPGLAGANMDMKDMQRCWTVKAILGNVPRGTRLVEIGAGEPLVAGVLSRLGYDVTVVDPYMGSGNGPREYETFRSAYPDVHFIREEFPPADAIEAGVGAVYSISVLEHVPLEQIDGVIGAARELLAPGGGASIHAVDHVVAGWGADAHREKLERIVAAMGLSNDELDHAIARLEGDPEAYFVSAEVHNRWRGDIPYDDYPMRRIGSVNLFAST
ncbi:MAG TPA: hypothetical protein VGF04_03800 [Solirubrobacterales bacterium]